MSHRDFTEVEPEGTSQLPAANRALFLDKVRQSNAACQNGDFTTAVTLYTDALQLDPTNHILYSNRSAAKLKQGHFAQALQDATTALNLCPTWPKAYYRQGVALQCLGRHGDALASFSQGLAQDPTSQQLLNGLIEASIKSPLRHHLEPTFQQLELMKLDQSPFVLISVVGQELLAAGLYHSAVTVLESALRIGSCSLKLRGSVFSALSSAHWALNQLDKAIGYMQQDLAIAKSLGDTPGECRAHGNLGSAYFSQGSYKEALTAHRYQLVLAMKCKDTQAAASALTSLGHVYTAIGDYPNALASHKQCVQLVKQMADKLQEAREIGNVGAVYLAMGDFDSALDCHTQHLRLARRLNNQVEEARAFSNLGSSHHYKRNFAQAIRYHEKVLRLAQAMGDKSVEARAYAGLGHAARCAGNFAQAKAWHERQLDVALSTRDKVGEGRACSNLGIVYQLLGEYDAALKLHQAHLAIARHLQDRAGMGRAFGNIGNAYSAAGYYESAIKYHKHELTISKEVHDRSSEASTHGNLAVAYQALGAHDMALLHYRAHLGIARELKDTAGEACALLNLANCLSSRNEFAEAIPFYEHYLMLSQELADIEGEAKACHFLGYAHYCIGNYREAVRYYDQDLALAKDLQDKMNMGRAYCNLGLAHLALGQLETSLECQKYFLAIAHMTNNLAGKFRALGNIGDVLIKMNEVEEAIKMYLRQLSLARTSKDKSMEAAACGALGIAHRRLKQMDKALGYHTQELTQRQEMGDLVGECRAHGHLGNVHMALANYTHAVKCYQEQLERAQELQDCAVEAQAYGNLGIARLNMAHYEDAIGYFEQQLATLERLNMTTTSQLDKARACGNLGDCYDALGDPEEAIKCHEQHLALALKLKSTRDQERAYRGLGQAQKSMGNLQQALVCLEKRLVVSHELGSRENKAAAYGELGRLHATLGNLEQAISCLEHQKEIAQNLHDRIMESEAVSNLGQVYQQMGQHHTALRYHQSDLEMAQELGMAMLEARACSNLGLVHESLANYEQAIRYQEQHLQIAIGTTDALGKTVAYSALGRVHQSMGNWPQAITYLKQGLVIAERLGRKDEEEVRIRNRLGMALWMTGDLDGAGKQLEMATHLLEIIRRDDNNNNNNTAKTTDLFDLQTGSYQILQRVLVALNRSDEALVVAEKYRTKAFVDLLLENSSSSKQEKRSSKSHQKLIDDFTNFNSLEQIKDIVNRQRSPVLYYSIAAGYLYAWLIVPSKGVVKFHSSNLFEDEEELSENKTSMVIPQSSGLLEKLVHSVRDSLGIQVLDDETTTTATTTPNNGFVRMVNRQHLLNSSNYSLSSLFSLGSVGGSVASLQGSTRSQASLNTAPRRQQWKGPSSLHALYALLIAPFEEFLPCRTTTRRELILVLQNDLFLVPFGMLRSSAENAEYLCERFSLLIVPNISSSLMMKSQRARKNQPKDQIKSLIVGNPKLPSSTAENWKDIPQAEQEATMVAELLQSQVLLGQQATKEQVVAQIQQAECVHFSTHISWQVGALVLASPVLLDQIEEDHQQHNNLDEISTTSSSEVPSYADFLLTPQDILSLKLNNARLVVINSTHTKDQNCLTSSSDGLLTLIRAFLIAGAHSVLVSLWPVPETASKIFLRAFYSALLQGTRAAKALAEAMQTVQHTKHFAHPANWAGFHLIGQNIRLSNKIALMGQALCELLKAPDKCRDALRVTLHLVEKSLQRIHRGQKNAMYTTQKSIETKVGGMMVCGWRELLMSVGFRFEPASNGIPSSVFFPQSDPDERLTQCSASLQALLGLGSVSLAALSKLTLNPDVSDDIIGVIQSALSQFGKLGENTTTQDSTVEVVLSVGLWRVPGCHELLASLGFDLIDVGQDKVTLRTGKQANRRNIQFTLQALLALFDEAPKNLSVDADDDGNVSSSSLDSMNSEDEDSSSTSDDYSEVGDEILTGDRKKNSTMLLTTKSQVNFSRGAFTSYVRRRGEPDGRTANPSDVTIKTTILNKVRNAKKNNGNEAAFTPSPPVVLQSVAMETNNNNNNNQIALSLAHQTRIKNLYSAAAAAAAVENGTSNKTRPDSSSSASSVNDWDNGHATVLRRTGISKPSKTLAELYNNLPGSVVFENSSDSELEKMEAKLFIQPPAQQRSSKVGSSSAVTTYSTRKANHTNLMSTLDRLSVRTELSSGLSNQANNTRIKPTNVEECTSSAAPSSERRLLYFNENAEQVEKSVAEKEVVEKASTIHDTILATQLRHINRELTPTISDVYHERSIGLGLAPPLSKLLLTATSTSEKLMEGATSQALEKITLGGLDLDEHDEEGVELDDEKSKPWMSASGGGGGNGHHIQSSDLTTADLLEREVKNKKVRQQLKGGDKEEMLLVRRDEGDGRSIPDSNYSSYKTMSSFVYNKQQSNEKVAAKMRTLKSGNRSAKQS